MPYHRIVIGVDFATASLAAVRWVVSTIGRRAKILLVHVTPEARRPTFLKRYLPAADVLDAAPTAYQGLRSLADLAGRDRSDVAIFTGNPAEGLALAAEEFGADLICVGRSRRRRGSGRFGATTPQRVVSRTPLPVLVVPENAPAQPTSVVAAVNEGSESAHVLRSAARIALASDARLDALHVIEPELHADARQSGHDAKLRITVDHLGAAALDALSDARLCLLAREWLAEQAAGLEMHEQRVTPIARLGDAGGEIIGHAVRSGAGLVVLGRCSDETSVGGMAEVGGTARLAMWVAPCPVLVLGLHSRSLEQSAGNGRLRHVLPTRDASPLAVVTSGSATRVRSARRPPPDGGDAA